MVQGCVLDSVGGKPDATVYPIIINYDLSLAEMIEVGQYGFVNRGITKEKFPVNGKGIKEIVTELIHFNRAILSEEAILELDKRALRPTTIEELLAFGAKYPDLQKQFMIVALGSIGFFSTSAFWDGRNVPYLFRGSLYRRELELGMFDKGWYEGCYFHAVHK